MPLVHDNQSTTQIVTDDVRGGTTGHGVRYVLGLSLVGAVVALIVAYYFLRVYH
jgi:hypothetical protein